MRTNAGPENQERGAPSGQVIIMFALFLTAMIGMLGLATDVGYAMSQKRTVQNAADAAALAGARQIANYSTENPTSAWADVNLFATKAENRIAATSQAVEECAYVNDASADVDTNCANLVPASATGVRVTVREDHSTFFIHVLPGAQNSVTSSASAIAHVQRIANIPSDGPFIVCGRQTKIAGSSTQRMDIVTKVNGEWKINMAADNKNFYIHGSQVEKCNAHAGRFKGLADGDANRNRSVPPERWFRYEEGAKVGFIDTDVAGVQGCKAGQEVNNCVAFLPIAVSEPGEQNNDRQVWTVAFAAFYVTRTPNNDHNGRLLANYIISGQEGEWGWERGSTGPVVIRLTG